MLKYVFPCTGRSGSKFIAELLKRHGVNCGHEQVYRVSNMVKDGQPTDTWSLTRDPYVWAEKFDAESSHNLAPFLNDPPCRQAQVVHIYRHPLRVIDSWRHQEHFGSFPFMSHHCPVWAPDPISFCAAMYVAWNRYIESQNWGAHTGGWTQCAVEDAEYLIYDVLHLDLEDGQEWPSKKTNSIGSEQITTINDIVDGHIRKALCELSEEYGYAI